MAEELLEDIQEDATGPTGPEASAETQPGKLEFIRKLVAGRKKLILVCAAALVILGLVIGLLIFFVSGDDEVGQEKADLESSVAAAKEEEIIFEDIVVLEPFERIRLKGNSAMGFISLDVSLELSDHRYRRQVYTVQERIRKIIIAQVRETTWLELRNPEGKIKLKYDLLKRINSIFPKITVRNLYFTHFLMQ